MREDGFMGNYPTEIVVFVVVVVVRKWNYMGANDRR